MTRLLLEVRISCSYISDAVRKDRAVEQRNEIDSKLGYGDLFSENTDAPSRVLELRRKVVGVAQR